MEEWKKARYTRVGTDHIKEKLPCQDRGIICENEKLLVAVLADGLGSLPYSEIAAEAATKAVCSFYMDENPENSINASEKNSSLIDYVTKSIIRSAEEKGKNPDKMNCTLAWVLIVKKSGKLYVGCLGDSAVCVVNNDGAIAVNGGSYRRHTTNSVFGKNAPENIIWREFNYIEDEILGFILSSDGLEGELYDKGGTLASKRVEIYINALLNESPEKTIESRINFLVTDGNNANDIHYYDDICVVVAGRIDKPIKLPDDPTWLCSCGARNLLYNDYCSVCNRDFVELYYHMADEFKRCGGKENFFIKVNKDPELEKRIVGCKTEMVEAYEEKNNLSPASAESEAEIASEIPLSDTGISDVEQNEGETINTEEKTDLSAVDNCNCTEICEEQIPEVTDNQNENSFSDENNEDNTDSSDESIEKCETEKCDTVKSAENLSEASDFSVIDHQTMKNGNTAVNSTMISDTPALGYCNQQSAMPNLQRKENLTKDSQERDSSFPEINKSEAYNAPCCVSQNDGDSTDEGNDANENKFGRLKSLAEERLAKTDKTNIIIILSIIIVLLLIIILLVSAFNLGKNSVTINNESKSAVAYEHIAQCIRNYCNL